MTTKRRAQGEGCITFDKGTGKWRGIANLGKGPDGKRRTRKVTADSKKEAAEKLAALRADLDARQWAPSTMTLGDLVDLWVRTVTPGMTPKTAAFNIRSANYSKDHLGAVKLKALRADHVEGMLRTLATRKSKPLNRTTIARTRSTLRRILKWGQGRDLVLRNVADFAELPPAAAPGTGRALSAEEVNRLLEAARGTHLEALWPTMIGLGLRPGEALGLQWDDIDFQAGTVHVHQSLKWTTSKPPTPYLGDLKNDYSHRTLNAPRSVLAALEAHRERSTTQGAALGWAADWDALVFRTENGRPVGLVNVRKSLLRLCAKAGIEPCAPYDCRHSCASFAANGGARLEDVADLLGHADLTMARRVYVHRSSEPIATAAAPLEAILAG